MIKWALPCIGLFLTLFVAERLSPVPRGSAGPVRGKYLVEQVAMCGDCHTPRKANGEADRARWMQGAALDFKPLHPMPWAAVAPTIAALPGWSEEHAVSLLETGLMPNGQFLRPPMPRYRFSHQDAEAAVAYLKSLARHGK